MPDSKIGKIVSYVREDGAKIDAIEPANMEDVLGGGFEWDEGKVPRFVGQAAVAIMDPRTGRPVGVEPVQFPIKAENINEAFDNFMPALQAHGEAMKEQRSEPKIQMPGLGGN